MARGRMLNKSVSLDIEVAELIEREGPIAGLLFTWGIAHLDRDGRISGDPIAFRAEVAPMLPSVSVASVTGMLSAAYQLGLIEVWQSHGKTVCHYCGFTKNQKLRYDREAPSRYPDNNGIVPGWLANSGPTPEDSGPTPDLLRTNSGPTPEDSRLIERKGKEGNGKECNTDLSKHDPKRAATAPGYEYAACPISGPVAPEVANVFAVWKKYHPDSRLTGSARALIRRRLKDYPAEQLTLAIHGIHLDPWEDRERYLSLKYCLKDDSSIERFIGYAKNPPKQKLPKHLQVVADFAAEERAKHGSCEILGPDDNPPALLPWDGTD